MVEIIEVGLYVFFEALAVVFCLHYLYGEKIYFDWISVCFVVIDVVWMGIIQIFHLNSKLSLMIYPIIIVYCGVKFGFNIKVIFINNILYMTIISSIQATIMVIFSIVFKSDTMRTFDILIINIITLFVVFFILKKCKLEKLSCILQENDTLIKISLMVIVMSIILFLIGYKQKRSFEILYYVILGVSIVLIVIAVMDIGKHKIEAREAEAELRLHKLYESSFRELIDEICARQHEFDNHISAIYSQHRLYKTYDELVEAQKKYCDEVMEENHYNKVLTNGNPVILCFLYSKFAEMKKRGIKVTYRINIGDLECGIPIHKIIELLGNLIKNAIEAVQQKGGNIDVSIVEECDKIYIEISNESEIIDEKRIREFFKKGYSEKGKGRGYGLYNVGKICEEYGVVVNCRNVKKEGCNWLVFKLLINKSL